jgi:hypothetical protein
MNYDLAVAWRIYPGVSKTPLIFPDDKFMLAQTCIRSFLASVSGLKVRYYFILDGCPSSYADMIRRICPMEHTTLIETPGIGNLATFRKQIEILSDQSDADLVYFAEDDYLYVPDAFHKMITLIRSKPEVDFVSPYLHPDTFTHPIHQHKKTSMRTEDHSWMSDSSTCLTFLTSKKNLLEIRPVLLTYSKGNNDCAMWLVLTKTFIRNPFAYLRFMLTHAESFSIMKVAVKYSFRYFFNRRRYRLWVPLPAIGTHLEKELVSPDTDWIKISNDINQ